MMTDIPTEAALGAERIATLDIVRGVAVMGILAMNIVGFAMPGAAYVNPLAYGAESGADLGAWLFDFILIDGKMRGLFSFLFGASMLLVVERAETAGRSPALVHFSRMGWLLVFGLVHFFFIWWGDILALYAPMGMLAYCFRRLEPVRLVVLGLCLLAAQFLLTSAFAVSLYAGSPPPPDPQAILEELSLYRGSYAAIVQHRLQELWMMPLNSLWQAGWETLAYMLFGMAALRSGFLTGAWERRRYLKAVVVGFGVGIPAYAAIAWWLIANRFSDPASAAGWLAATVPFRPLMILGIASLVILAAAKGGWLAERIAAAGRAAFTNYLGTSLLMTTLFYGYGLGWFGHLSRIALWLPVIAMWAIMLLWSKFWLDRFRYGPFEWLWRSLSRFKLQPMRHPSSVRSPRGPAQGADGR